MNVSSIAVAVVVIVAAVVVGIVWRFARYSASSICRFVDDIPTPPPVDDRFLGHWEEDLSQESLGSIPFADPARESARISTREFLSRSRIFCFVLVFVLFVPRS